METPSALESPSAITLIPATKAGLITRIPTPLGEEGGGSTPFANTYSADFDGTDDYATIADANDLSFGNASTDSAFSIIAWIKMDDATKFRIISKANSTSDAEWFLTISGSDKLRLDLLDADNNNRIGIETDAAITAHEGSWINVIATYDGDGDSSTMVLYINGAAQATSSIDSGSYTAMHNTAAPVWIGGLAYGPDFANGKIDEVAIIPSELSAVQVTDIYNSGEPADLTSYSPVLWIRFEEGSGTSITDSSGNGHTATLTNGPTFETDVPGVTPFTNTYSIDLNGTNQYMEADGIATDAASDNVGSFSAWIAPTDASPSNSETVIAFGDANANSYLEINIGGITQTIIKAACMITGTQQWVLATSDLGWADDAWHHIAVTHDGSTATMYIDGVDISAGYTVSTDKTKWLTDIAGIDTYTVGALEKNSAVSQYFDGKIDEPAYFSSELSAAQVLAIYNSGNPIGLDSYSPVGWHRFEEGTGTSIANDGSASSSDGTLINAPTFSTDVPT